MLRLKIVSRYWLMKVCPDMQFCDDTKYLDSKHQFFDVSWIILILVRQSLALKVVLLSRLFSFAFFYFSCFGQRKTLSGGWMHTQVTSEPYTDYNVAGFEECIMVCKSLQVTGQQSRQLLHPCKSQFAIVSTPVIGYLLQRAPLQRHSSLRGLGWFFRLQNFFHFCAAKFLLFPNLLLF